ncbi:MAG: V-type ATPase subunit [bacterium]
MPKQDYKPITPTKWNYASGWIKALEKDIISNSQFQTIISGKTDNDLLKSLGETIYKNLLKNQHDLWNSEELLDKFVQERLNSIGKASPQPIVSDYFKVKPKMQQLKIHLKNELSKQGEDKGKKLQMVDFVSDQKMLTKLYEIGEKSENELIKKYTDSYIELRNLYALWRLKSMNKGYGNLESIIFLFPGSQFNLKYMQDLYETPLEKWDESLTEPGYQGIFIEDKDLDGRKAIPNIEKRCDDYLLNLIKPAKYIPFGIEVVFSYVVAFLAEILNIKIIIIGKLNKLAEDIIQKKVRDSYV